MDIVLRHVVPDCIVSFDCISFLFHCLTCGIKIHHHYYFKEFLKQI